MESRDIENAKVGTFEEICGLDEAVGDGLFVIPGRVNFPVRKAAEESRRLGRPLTDEELLLLDLDALTI